MTAVPSTGCEFEQWSGDIGDIEANSSTINIVMDTDRTVVAGFKGCAVPLEITIDAVIYAKGTNIINASFGTITCIADGIVSNATVNVTAVAAEGYRFDGWSGPINGSKASTSFVVSFATGFHEPLTAHFSIDSPTPLWIWAVIGVAAVILLLIVVLIYKVLSGRKKKAQKNAPNDATSPPEPQPSQPPQIM